MKYIRALPFFLSCVSLYAYGMDNTEDITTPRTNAFDAFIPNHKVPFFAFLESKLLVEGTKLNPDDASALEQLKNLSNEIAAFKEKPLFKMLDDETKDFYLQKALEYISCQQKRIQQCNYSKVPEAKLHKTTQNLIDQLYDLCQLKEHIKYVLQKPKDVIEI